MTALSIYDKYLNKINNIFLFRTETIIISKIVLAIEISKDTIKLLSYRRYRIGHVEDTLYKNNQPS